jgi:hypothetical protein
VFGEPTTFAASRFPNGAYRCGDVAVPIAFKPVANNGWPQTGPGSVAAGDQAVMLMTLTSSALRNDLHGGIHHKAVLDALLVGLTSYGALAPRLWVQ